MRTASRFLMAFGLLLSMIVPAPTILAQSRDTVVIGMAHEPDGFLFPGAAATLAVSSALFIGMTERDAQGRLIPRLAEKIPSIADGDWEVLPGKKMRVTFRLRRGYTWYDGRPVTALDAAWSYLMLRNPRSPTVSRFLVAKIEHMLVPDPGDPYTLVVQWAERYPFPYACCPVYPRHILEREYLKDPGMLRAHRQARAPVGNGPYRFVEWVPGSHILLEEYEAFPEGRPRIRRLLFRFVPDATVLQAQVMAGQVDVSVINNFSVDQAMLIERRTPQVVAHLEQGTIWEHIAFNLDQEWLRDRRLRWAVAHAIDREAIARTISQGRQTAAHTWVPVTHEGHHQQIKRYAYDPAAARRLLAEAGFTAGADGILRDQQGRRLELRIMTTSGSPLREQVLQIMQQQLGAVGIELAFDFRPPSVLFGQIAPRRQWPHLAMYGLLFGPLSLPILWHSSQIPSPQNNWEGLNRAGWRNPENDRLIDAIAQELDPGRRLALFRRHQDLWADDLPAIPMYFHLLVATRRRELRNFTLHSLGGFIYRPERWAWADR